MANALGNEIVTQIGVLCRDVEATAKAYSEFFGQDFQVSGTPGPEIARCEFMGAPSKAGCRQAFFQLGQVQLELIEPDDTPSVWRDDLEQYGEGLHHIAFWVKDSDTLIARLDAKGMPLRQKGCWDTGRYAYIDAREQLKLTLELLENTGKAQ